MWRVVAGYLCVVQLVLGSDLITFRDNENQGQRYQDQESYTDESKSQIELTEMRVTSTISMRYSYTEVIAHVRNSAERAQQTSFNLLLPETAFISGFAMTINGKEYKAYVKEKKEAKKIYNEAVSQGLGAATVSTKARDSNRFIVSVNVEPNSNAIFNLTYEELLVRRNGVYNQIINLHPGGVVPKLTVTVHIKESQSLTALRVPEIKTGNEVDADEFDIQYSEAVITRNRDSRQATITFRPDEEEQKRLMMIYDKKVNEILSNRNEFFQSRSRRSIKTESEGSLGQFGVQYDVFRPDGGEILVNNGYFAQFLAAPDSSKALDKYVVFVLDTSASMYGTKIDQLKTAMQTILNELNKGDYFSIMEFASVALVHDLEEANSLKQPTTVNAWIENDEEVSLKPPLPATPENIAKAEIIISRLLVDGGTNIGSALDTAAELARTGMDLAKNPENKNLEKIIIFLTDGQPSVGEYDTEVLIKDFTAKNDKGENALLFVLGFGVDVDFDFLHKLALSNNGFAKRIYESGDANKQLYNFFRQVSKPVLSHVGMNYPSDQIQSDSVTQKKFRMLFGGGELVVAGRLVNGVKKLSPDFGLVGATPSSFPGTATTTVRPSITFQSDDEGSLPLERIWAYLRIRQLLDERDLANFRDLPRGTAKEAEKKALELALQYGFVTPVTSLVVVKPNDTNIVDTESLDIRSFSSGSTYSAPYGGQASHYGLLASGSFGQSGIGAGGQSFASGPNSPSYGSAQGSYYGTPPPTGVGFPQSGSFSPSNGDLNNIVSSIFSSGTAGQGGGPPNVPVLLHDQIQYQSYNHTIIATTRRPPTVTPVYTLSPPYPDLPSTNRPPSNPEYPEAESPTFNPIEFFNLAGFDWVLDLMDGMSDSLVVSTKNFTKHLRLASGEVPRRTLYDAQCWRSIDGWPGLCVYLTRCESAKNITAQLYLTTYCTVNDEYAGVCCPRKYVQ